MKISGTLSSILARIQTQNIILSGDYYQYVYVNNKVGIVKAGRSGFAIHGEGKMKLLAYAKLLNRKINSAHKKAKNPFLDYTSSYNPFNRPMYNTLVWIEEDDNQNPEQFDKY